jgi:hypothetical protein
MSVRNLLKRWRDRLALRAAARVQFEAVIYFEGPVTLWQGTPHDSDVICRKQFRVHGFAEGWARTRLRDFQKCDFVVRRIA